MELSEIQHLLSFTFSEFGSDLPENFSVSETIKICTLIEQTFSWRYLVSDNVIYCMCNKP